MGRLAKSFICAIAGISSTFRSERNFRIHVAALCVALAAGLYLGLAALEWGFVVLSMGLVLAAELFNTAIERLADKEAGGQYDLIVKRAKDASAAAVLLTAATAFAIGTIFLLVPLVRKISSLLGTG
jgi:diacylglycerol kinase